MAMADVTVYGAGAFGLACAWACARRGAKVRVIDPHGPGAGSSGGLVGALAPHVPENWNDKKQFQFESLLMAADWWAEVTRTGGKDSGYARLGRLQPVADENALNLAQARALSAAKLWRGQADWQVISASDCGDWAPLSPTGWLIRDTLSARMSPRMAGAALVAALHAAGAEVTSEADPEGRILWATGVAGLAEISTALGRNFGGGVKGQSALLQLDRRDCPQLFSNAIHVVPHADGTVAIGSTTERAYDDPGSTDSQLDSVLDRARLAVPALEGAKVMDRWAGVRPRARSRAPVLGEHPLNASEFIANGGFKIGFGMAPKVAETMADLILDGRNTIPEGFLPQASL